MQHAPATTTVLTRSAQANGPQRRLPKAPVLDWAGLRPGRPQGYPCIGDIPSRRHTTSGRAALHAAIGQLPSSARDAVLVPAYHCPTMVAPIILRGLHPVFYPIGDEGLPDLERIPDGLAQRARAIIVAHYFGLPNDLGAVDRWCREHRVALIEDCAHCYFGQAGDRPVGHWGDYATASLSKFFPLGEAGLVASTRHALPDLGLATPSLRAEVKGAVDVLEFAHRHARLQGVSQLLSPLFALKNMRQMPTAAPREPATMDERQTMDECDMARVAQRPVRVARLLHALLPVGPIIDRRRSNYAHLASALEGANGSRLLARTLPAGAVPYVLPLWVDGPSRADAIYARIRDLGLPVFRWDRLWPGTPTPEHDTAARWSRELLQVLCHQDLTSAEADDVGARIRGLLRDM